MTPEEHATGGESPHGRDSRFEPLPIPLRTTAWRRSVGPQLTKRQIATENGPTRRAELRSKSQEKRSVAVRARAVREDEAIATSADGDVQRPANGQLTRIILKRLKFAHWLQSDGR
jgi:hypothetical protein